VLAQLEPNRSPQEQIRDALIRVGAPRHERATIYRVRLNRLG